MLQAEVDVSKLEFQEDLELAAKQLEYMCQFVIFPAPKAHEVKMLVTKPNSIHDMGTLVGQRFLLPVKTSTDVKPYLRHGWWHGASDFDQIINDSPIEVQHLMVVLK